MSGHRQVSLILHSSQAEFDVAKWIGAPALDDRDLSAQRLLHQVSPSVQVERPFGFVEVYKQARLVEDADADGYQDAAQAHGTCADLFCPGAHREELADPELTTQIGCRGFGRRCRMR